MHPIISAICSLIIPGLGQALNGDIKKGVILFVCAFIITMLAMFVFKQWIVSIIGWVIAIYAAYDAYITAN